MSELSRNAAFGVFFAAVVLIACVGVLHSPQEGGDEEADLNGTWYLVNSHTLDQDGTIRHTVNSNLDMSLTVVDDSNIFYGTVQGIDVAGVFIDGCVIMEYQSDICLVRLTGWISDGQIHTREVHYYTTNDDPVWFVADNIYSKDPALLNQAMDETPSVDSTWTSWSGFYIDVDGERHDLAGALFSVTKVEGSLLRAEIELSDGSDTMTVVLNGVIVDTYEEDGGTVVTANLLDEAGRLWSLYMTGDVAPVPMTKHSL